jgi:hypothetical protein
MENQGKRPDQVEFSEKVTFWCYVGMIFMVAMIALFG